MAAQSAPAALDPVVSPPSEISKIAAPNTATNRPAGTGNTPDSPMEDARSVAAPAMDRADIRPLDLAGALQILIAEVRAELTFSLLQAIDTSTPADATIPVTIEAVWPAALDILESVLRCLPENSPKVALWSEALPVVDAAVESGLARAAAIIDAWRDVPGPVVASARELHVLVLQALSDEPLNPLWLRPEGLKLAPRLMRLRRRRKFLQRRLTDPDYRPSFFDDPEPLT